MVKRPRGCKISLRIRETDVEAKDKEEFDRFPNQAMTPYRPLKPE
jgi:hypothetical protein